MLRLYRNIKYAFADMMGFVYIGIDFSENLTMRIKFEPQLCHWSKLRVTIHPGLVLFNNVKAHHPCITNYCAYDQVFINQVLKEILSTLNIPEGISIVIKSNNCSG